MAHINSSWVRVVILSCVLGSAAGGASGCSSASDEAGKPGVVQQALATPTGTIPGASYSNDAALLSDGRVLVAGGVTKNGTNDAPSKAAALFDPATNQWTATGNLNAARTSTAMIRLSDGRVLVSGGHNLTLNTLSSNEVYDPASGTFSVGFGNLSVPRWNHAAVLLNNGSVMVAGGATGSTNAQRAEIIGGGLVFGWLGPWHGLVSLTRASDHTILALFDAEAWIFDETTTAWSHVASPIVPRRGQKVLRLAGGSLLMLGGQVTVPNPSGSGSTLANTELVELFDPITGAWSATGSLSRPSEELDHLVNIPGGDALLIGSKLRVERYSAATGSWSLLEPLSKPPLTATTLDSGNVLVTQPTGGFDYIATAEVYDFASPPCTQTSCAEQGAVCGPIDDGCGNVAFCGSCAAGEFCSDGTCSCSTLTTCAAQNKNCGSVADGCGGTLNCGSCAVGQTCSNNVCSTPPPTGSCTHSECTTGTKLTSSCSACAQKVCGVDPYCCSTAWDSICVNKAKSMCTVCALTCTPSTCSSLGKNCGSVSNGCGGALSCGSCAAGQTCGNNVCITTPPAGACAHSQCSSGTKLTSGCTSCVTSICAVDPYCCNTAWDSICVGRVASVCNQSCP